MAYFGFTPGRSAPILLTAILLSGCAAASDPLGGGSARKNFDRGVAFYAKGSYQKAIESYQLAIQARPSFTEAHFGLGVAFIKTEFFRGALLALGRALELRADYPEAHYNLGVAYHRLDRHADAIRHYRVARSQKPDMSETDLPLARAYEVVGNVDSARAVYLSAVPREPLEANLGLARLARLAGDTSLHIRHLEVATEADSTRFEPWLDLAGARERSGQLKEALDAYERAFALREGHPGLIAKLGGLHVHAGDLPRARDLFTIAAERDSTDSRAFYNLGVVYDALNDRERAIEAYRRCLAIDPSFDDAQLNLSIAFFEMRRFKEALEQYEILMMLEIDDDRRRQVTKIVDQLRAALGPD